MRLMGFVGDTRGDQDCEGYVVRRDDGKGRGESEYFS